MVLLSSKWLLGRVSPIPGLFWNMKPGQLQAADTSRSDQLAKRGYSHPIPTLEGYNPARQSLQCNGENRPWESESPGGYFTHR